MPAIASPRLQKKPRLEIIPFIDIMFFLLATFMMVSLTMIQNQGMELNLPQTRSAALDPEMKERTTLSITKEGLVFLDKEQVGQDELVARLRRIKAERPEAKLIIQSDTETPFGRVMEVLDEARLLGLSKFLIRTRKAEKPVET